MKKVSIICIIAALCIALTYGIAGAVATGACANCHTMHNMQNGQVVAAGGPYGVLLKGNCFGCHSQGLTTGTNIVNNTPQVAHTNATDLAGGNFAYITAGKAVDAADSVAVANPDTCGHNVSELGNPEGYAAMFPPPGDEYAQAITAANFTCGGVYGCHGDRTAADSFAAVKGSHHVNDTVMKFGASLDEASQGATTALSYRFLKGVKGAEDSDWQATVAADDHNEYKGATDGVEAGSASVPGGSTISGLCAECHGNFHGPRAVASDITNTATGSPWLRHPTDIILPNSTEYQYYNGGAGGGAAAPYSVDAPVARADTISSVLYTTPKATATPGTSDAIVMCLSCHRAHASANADLVRWNYEDISAGTGADATRCFICHTTKDTGS